MNNYSNAFTEVYTILNYLEDEEYEKIPSDVIEVIEKNRNKDYFYEIEELDLKKQPMMKETKAILFNIFRDYLSTMEQKEKIIKIQQEKRIKNELKKKQQYDVKVFSNREKNDLSEGIEPKLEIVKYKENILKKFVKKLKNFFNKNF